MKQTEKDALKFGWVGFVEGNLPHLDENLDINLVNQGERFEVYENVLSSNECSMLIDFFNKSKKVNTGKKTIKLKYGKSKNGIERNCFYDISFAEQLFNRFKGKIESLKYSESKQYKCIGFNPLMRFIKYTQGHSLIPHYDKTVKINEDVLTLRTIVVYLNKTNSGSTNILKDIRINHNYEDCDADFPVVYKQMPLEGVGLMFDHLVFHESDVLSEKDEKYILTTEICYVAT